MEPSPNENRTTLLTGGSKSPLAASNTWYSNLASLLISYLLYYLFSTFTTDIFYYESTECIILLKHSQSIANLYYYYAFITGFCFLTCLIGCDMSGLKTLLQTMVTLIIAVYLIIVTGDLLKGEPCGELRTLAIIWTVYEWITITCICCACCCLICAVGIWGVSAASSGSRRN